MTIDNIVNPRDYLQGLLLVECPWGYDADSCPLRKSYSHRHVPHMTDALVRHLVNAHLAHGGGGEAARP